MQEEVDMQEKRLETVRKTVQAYRAGKAKPNDTRHHRRAVEEAIEQHIGDRRVCSLTTDDVRNVLATLEQQAASRHVMRRLVACMGDWLWYLDAREWLTSHEVANLWNELDSYRHAWESRNKRRVSELQQIYRMYDANGQLLYVGISGSAIARLVEHAKSKPWIAEVVRVDIVTARCSREQMEDREAQVIQNEQPRYNVVRMTRRRRGRLTDEQEFEMAKKVAAKHC